MKTLRIVRNIAVLFLLLASPSGTRPGFGNGTHKSICGFAAGRNCTFNYLTGACADRACKKGETCYNSGCVTFCPDCK